LARVGVRDARSLPAAARDQLRREVVLAVRDGMTRLEAARRFGVSRRTVGIWSRTFHTGNQPAMRDRADALPAATHSVLTVEQEWTLLRLMRAALPSQLGLDGHLWTRRSVAEIIRIETGHPLDAAGVDHYLTRWSLASRAIRDPRPDGVAPRTVMLSCHAITPPGTSQSVHSPVSAEVWPVLVAESGNNAIHFRLAAAPVDQAGARAFGRHLAQQHTRPITLHVWRWPDTEHHVLRAWQDDPGPGLVIAAASDGQFTTDRDSGCAPAR
jgi:transposase